MIREITESLNETEAATDIDSNVKCTVKGLRDSTNNLHRRYFHEEKKIPASFFKELPRVTLQSIDSEKGVTVETTCRAIRTRHQLKDRFHNSKFKSE